MSDLDFTIGCTVTFFSKKRRIPPNLNNGIYYPHFVIKGTEEYLGINFIDGEDVIFDKPIQANALPVYETVDYSAIQAGAEFLIMEGGNIVGEGIVKEILIVDMSNVFILNSLRIYKRQRHLFVR